MWVDLGECAVGLSGLEALNPSRANTYVHLRLWLLTCENVRSWE